MKKFAFTLVVAASTLAPVVIASSGASAAGAAVTTECAQRRNDVTVARRGLEVAESNVRIAKATLQRLKVAKSRTDGRLYVALKANTEAAYIQTRSAGYEATAQAKFDAAQASLATVLAQSNLRTATAARKAMAKAQAELAAAAKITAGATERAGLAAARAGVAQTEADTVNSSVDAAAAAWQATYADLPGAAAAVEAARAGEKIACPQVKTR